MTFCTKQTNLLASAGGELAEKLLPKPFCLWHSNHDTGTQMTIVAPNPTGGALIVWRGSVWHHSRYEFNDKDHIPGLQPEFEFSGPVIEKYFSDVAEAVEVRNAEHREANERRAAEAETARLAAIEAIKHQIMN